MAISGHGLLRLSVERFRPGCSEAAISYLHPNSLLLTGLHPKLQRERSLLDPSGGISSPLLRVKRGCLLTLMIVSNGCHAYRIKPERDKFRATPKSRVGRPTVWSAESALLLKARFWEQNANRGHHGRENPGKRFRCVCRCSRTAARDGGVR